MKKFIMALAIAAAVWLPAWADFDVGMAAYRAKDFDKAFQEFQKSAIDGHETAQFNLGVMYYRGQGVDKDLVNAFGWIELATQRGDEDFVGAQEVLILLMSPDQISEGHTLAGQLAAEHGLRYRAPDSVLQISDR